MGDFLEMNFFNFFNFCVRNLVFLLNPLTIIFTSGASKWRISVPPRRFMNCVEQFASLFCPFSLSRQLGRDLSQVKTKFGYEFIEFELNFAMDLYPFYPPLVKVIRPRLQVWQNLVKKCLIFSNVFSQGAMMQRVTNMEILKLSFWYAFKAASLKNSRLFFL